MSFIKSGRRSKTIALIFCLPLNEVPRFTLHHWNFASVAPVHITIVEHLDLHLFQSRLCVRTLVDFSQKQALLPKSNCCFTGANDVSRRIIAAFDNFVFPRAIVAVLKQSMFPQESLLLLKNIWFFSDGHA